MSDLESAGTGVGDLCNYPGCDRPRRPDPATGRPARYCGQADETGGPVHTAASAWRARQAATANLGTREESSVSAPVSLARATLEQRLSEWPDRVADLRGYLDGVIADIRSAGDVEAAGAEVEDAHRDALTKVTEAERRAATAERAARSAGERAHAAERDREEADSLLAEAIAETDQVRSDSQSEIERVRAEAAGAVAHAQEQLEAARADHAQQLAQRDADVARAREETAAAHVQSAAALAAQQAAEDNAAQQRDAAAQLRSELDQARHAFEIDRDRLQGEILSARDATQRAIAETSGVRIELATAQADITALQRAAAVDREALASLARDVERERADAHTERDALRASHAEQLAWAERSADDRVQALTEALTAAREVAETYRAQLTPTAPPKTTTQRSSSPRKRTPGPAS